jgi:hypothetical protein
MKRFIIHLLFIFSFIQILAQENNDTSTTVLHEIVVEAKMQQLGKEVSYYYPSTKQKNASQNAADLLNRMAIPQIRVSYDDQITDMTGKSVDVFIDYVPATQEIMEGMQMKDVKKIEYYDYPSDPRFQGKPHVVNFIMQKYEYGGYVKAYLRETTTNSGRFSLYSKLQYKRMSFDLALGSSYSNQNHSGVDTYETFRLQQTGGTESVFDRNSIQEKREVRTRTYWPTLKMLYSSRKIRIQNIIGANFNHMPLSEQLGYIYYKPEEYARTDYSTQSTNRVNSVSYSGYWNFIINDKNTITITPKYVYSHTNTSTLYAEQGVGEYYNAAKDDSHQFTGDLTYAHSFGRWGNVNGMLQSIITTNSTNYLGTANLKDEAHTYRVGPGVRYSLSREKIYGMVGFGFHWDRQEYLDYKNTTAAPWVDLSLQYSPNNRHSVRGDFHYKKSIPSSSYRSAVVIKSNPLMSYTGNPNLVSYGSYDFGINYTFIPNNKYSFSAFASSWLVEDRYVYDYKPSSTGIIRTIQQPEGNYSQWDYGVNATFRLFDRKLQLTSQLNAKSVSNGEPYNFNKTKLGCALQANLYLGSWTLSGMYYSPLAYSDGLMVGAWISTKSYYRLQAGWSNTKINVQLQLANFARWNWKGNKSEMSSQYYDKKEQMYSVDNHAFARLSVTYVFSYGKKIKRGDEVSQQSEVNSGILK